jgi:hypothetical protein
MTLPPLAWKIRGASKASSWFTVAADLFTTYYAPLLSSALSQYHPLNKAKY